MRNPAKIVFVSTNSNEPWGGSELLWSETALSLQRSGHTVSASVCGWPREARQLSPLRKAGVNVSVRWFTPEYIRPRAFRKILELFVRQASLRVLAQWLARQRPDLICISNGSFADDLLLQEICARSGRPYVSIVHANGESMWQDDQRARKIIDLCAGALRVFFVANRNRVLLETQLGVELPNAEVVRNPFNVSRDAAPPWPSDDGTIRLACVGRLDPRSKGQDLILHVLAREPWRSRPLKLSFFGHGVMEEGLRRLTRRLGLDRRVEFCGHIDDIEQLWSNHHALILPSRYEGLPLVIVEAMLCGRPVIVTDVGGNAELVQDGRSGFVAEAPTVDRLNMAMQRAWERRQDWEKIGQIAAQAIRTIVPLNPAADFARRLLDLAEARNTWDARASEIALAKAV